MSKPTGVSPLLRARRTLLKAGASPDDIDRFALELLRDVFSHAGIGGEIGHETVDKIEHLASQLGEMPFRKRK